MRQIITILSLTLLFFITACYYDKKDLIYPQTTVNCDTTTVGFNAAILPILQTNCNNCHSSQSAASSGANIVLDNYNAVKIHVNNSSLLNSILQNGKASAMPKNSVKMDACSINKVTAWINKGALNN